MYAKITPAQMKSFVGEIKTGESLAISSAPDKKDAYSPPELVLLSLGACTGLFIPPAIKEYGYSVDDYQVEVSAEKSKNPPQLFESITIKVTFQGDLTEEEAKQIMEKSHQRCFILHSLNPNIKIIDEIVIEKNH